MKKDEQILKCRDDKAPIFLSRLAEVSQCNSFILHRISNDRDQELVRHLASQNAILLGWASELPVLVKMNDLPKSQQPHSDDPDFWNVWTGKDADGKSVERKADWKPIVDDWQRPNQTEE